MMILEYNIKLFRTDTCLLLMQLLYNTLESETTTIKTFLKHPNKNVKLTLTP